MAERTVVWTQDEELLHALAAGSTSPTRTVESSNTTPFASFLTTLAFRSALPLLAGSPVRADDAIIGEVEFEIGGLWPSSRALRVSGSVAGPWDLGSMAIIRVDQSFLGDDGWLGNVTLSIYLPGQGNFGGKPPRRVPRAPLPRTEPRRIPVTIADNAALLYRLLGDRNPLHTNPQAGPAILHGLLGVASVERALEDELGARLTALRCRLNRPLWTGELAELEVWPNPEWTPLRLSARGEEAWTVASARLSANAALGA